MPGFMRLLQTVVICVFLLTASFGHAESQINDYPGVKDPFGDPSNYEFSEDEQSDKEFFHLGRFLMLGVDIGAGIFTGGLGKTTLPALAFGGRLLFFFDRSVALEAAIHYAYHEDNVNTGSVLALYDNDFIPINLGFRYYFDTRGAPRAISIANPYLAAGAGIYIRTLTLAPGSTATNAPNDDSKNFGIYGGGGVEFPVYGNHFFIGADVRYHMIFFADESGTLNGLVPAGDRGGDYLTTMLSMTYNF
jgi:hypothetical protein